LKWPTRPTENGKRNAAKREHHGYGLKAASTRHQTINLERQNKSQERALRTKRAPVTLRVDLRTIAGSFPPFNPAERVFSLKMTALLDVALRASPPSHWRADDAPMRDAQIMRV